jgi:hypothetical protein
VDAARLLRGKLLLPEQVQPFHRQAGEIVSPLNGRGYEVAIVARAPADSLAYSHFPIDDAMAPFALL